jgi:H+/Cl- antiporter ClcA
MTRLDRLKALGQWMGIGAVVGVLCGASSALFLYILERATAFRNGHEFIVYTLPVAGLVIGWFYERFGRSIEGGNNLIIDTIHDEGPEIPTRMAPMVLIGSVLTHLFSGSAGREGVAVQMGASLADGLSHRLKLTPQVRKQILAAGVAGGFGSVFGTPIAGAIFGMEFITLGSMVYGALVPALVASVIGDMTTRALGIHHIAFPAPLHLELTPILLFKWLLFAIAMGDIHCVYRAHAPYPESLRSK